MFRCGLVRTNWLLAMMMLSSLDARKAFAETRELPDTRARTAHDADTLPRGSAAAGEGSDSGIGAGRVHAHGSRPPGQLQTERVEHDHHARPKRRDRRRYFRPSRSRPAAPS